MTDVSFIDPSVSLEETQAPVAAATPPATNLLTGLAFGPLAASQGLAENPLLAGTPGAAWKASQLGPFPTDINVPKAIIGNPSATPPPYGDLIADAAKKYEVDPSLITKVIGTESNFDPRSVNAVTGAQGLGNLMPDTAKGLGVTDPFDPKQNIDAVAQYLKQGLQKYGGDVTQALKYYYGGPNEKEWGPNTAAYPAKVMAYGQPPTQPTLLASASPTAAPPGAATDIRTGVTNALNTVPTTTANENAQTVQKVVSGMLNQPPSAEQSQWQKMQTLLMMMQLTQAGTHQFVPVDYDPWKYTPQVRTGMRSQYEGV